MVTNFRAGLLTIRAWAERGSSSPLRATISVSKDVSGGFDKTTTVTSPETAAEVVKDWLNDVEVTDALAELDDKAGSGERSNLPLGSRRAP